MIKAAVIKSLFIHQLLTVDGSWQQTDWPSADGGLYHTESFVLFACITVCSHQNITSVSNVKSLESWQCRNDVATSGTFNDAADTQYEDFSAHTCFVGSLTRHQAPLGPYVSQHLESERQAACVQLFVDDERLFPLKNNPVRAASTNQNGKTSLSKAPEAEGSRQAAILCTFITSSQ